MKLSKVFVTSFIVAVLALTSCAGGGPKTVKVAVAMPLGLEVGEDMLNGVKLALEEAGGKAGNHMVELVVFDTSDPEGSPVSVDLEREAAVKAAEDEAVVGYIGAATTDQAKAITPVLNNAGIVEISPSASWPGLTKPGYGPGEPGIYYPTGRRHFFRMIPSDDVQGEMAARWASQLGFENVYVVHDGTAYGQGVAGLFEVRAGDLGLQILGVTSFDAEDAAQVNEAAVLVDEAQPDLLFFGGGYGYGGEVFIPAFRELNTTAVIMGIEGIIQDEFITDIGADLVNGMYATNSAVPVAQLASAEDLMAAYQAAYGKEPPSYAVNCYEAMKVLLYAIERAEEPTREGVLAAMKNLGEFSGVLGSWRFDDRGDISNASISGMQIQNGAWTFVQVIE